MEAINTSQLADSILSKLNQDVEDHFDADVVLIKSGMPSPLDDEFRTVVEKLKTRDSPKSKLCVVLETNGGYIETVKRLVDVMRRHYEIVSFIVPNYAYSAGTILVLSGDSIYMDYYSVLGPIDPQYVDEKGESLLPGVGYLAKFEELTKKINESGSASDCRAELSYLIKKFDPAKLFHIEQAIEQGQALIEGWLPVYKFKNWGNTMTPGQKVTLSMKKDRAKSIAATLGDATKWHSHGRGISMVELMADDIKLRIDDFGSEPELSSIIRNYHGLAVDFGAKQGLHNFIHTQDGLRRVL